MDLDKFKEGVIWLARMFLHVLNGLGRVVKVLLLINYLSWGLPLITWRIEEEFFSPVSLSCVPFFFHHYNFCGFCLFICFSLLGAKDGVWTCHAVIPMGNLNDPVCVFHPCLAMPSGVQWPDLRGVRNSLLSHPLILVYTGRACWDLYFSVLFCFMD